MIAHKSSRIPHHKIMELLKENELITAKDVIDFLYGAYDDQFCSDYVVKYRFGDEVKRTFFNRVNLLWVYPVFFVTLPARYLFTGRIGIQTESSIGKALTFLLGKY